MLIKICGITAPKTAIDCFEAGADMIGLVYYPASPRHVDPTRISKILDAAEPYRKIGHKTVLVTVDVFPDFIDPRIDFIQCYGESSEEHSEKKIPVLRHFNEIDHHLASMKIESEPPFYVLEMSHGAMPGGNGQPWDWSEAEAFCQRFSTLLAGGITPDNVCEALKKAKPAGIDVSSGVESAPGIKDMSKVATLIDRVRKHSISTMKGEGQ